MFFVMSLLSYAAFPTFFDADSSTYISHMSVDSFDVNMCLCGLIIEELFSSFIRYFLEYLEIFL